jgi:hypothetical protein
LMVKIRSENTTMPKYFHRDLVPPVERIRKQRDNQNDSSGPGSW